MMFTKPASPEIDALVGYVASLARIEDQLDSDRVSSPVQAGSLFRCLDRNYDLDHGHSLRSVACDVFDMLCRDTVHPNHRCQFGWLVPEGQAAGVVAIKIAALLNPQLGARCCSTAACDIET
jgi:hypothetical protein